MNKSWLVSLEFHDPYLMLQDYIELELVSFLLIGSIVS